MIITRTPFRISLFGGGTDHPAYYNEYGGAVLGFALNKYCWITLRELPPFYDYRYRIVYSREEHVKTAAEIDHPVVKAILSKNEPSNGHGFEIHYDGDIPARTGLGSSSAFTVGLLKAFEPKLYNPGLALSAISLEQNVLQEVVGSQDQCWAAYGGFKRIDFNPIGIFVSPIYVLGVNRIHSLIDHLCLFFTGFQRTASEVESIKLTNFKQKTTQLKRIREIVDEAETLIRDEKRPILEIGQLLHETWMMKKELAKDVVSNPHLDDIYHRGLLAGAIGGKLLGAGGGGFFLFLVAPHMKTTLRKELSELIEIEVGIDWEGSTVIYNNNGI